MFIIFSSRIISYISRVQNVWASDGERLTTAGAPCVRGGLDFTALPSCPYGLYDGLLVVVANTTNYYFSTF